MGAALRPVVALYISVAILLMGNGLQRTLLPVRGSLEEFGDYALGVMGAAYYLGFGLSCFLGPYVIRRVGHIRSFAGVVSVASTVALAHSLVLQPWAWWIFHAITGFCFAIIYMVIESWLNEKATNETRGVVFSVYTIINLSVMTIGQMMLTLSSPAAFTLFAVASILVSLSTVPVVMTTAPAPAPPAIVRVRPRYLYKLSPVGVIGCLAIGFGNGAFWALAPVYAERVGGSLNAVAVFMSVTVIAGALGQWPLGRLSDKMDRRKIIIVCCLGACFAALGLVATGAWSPWTFYLFGALFGAFAFPVYSLLTAHTNDFVEAGGYVEAASGLMLVFAAGAVIGPILAATLMDLRGPYGLFVFTAIVHVALAAFVVFRMTRRDAPLEEGRATFGDSLVQAQIVSNIDARSGTGSAGPGPGAEPGPAPDKQDQPPQDPEDDRAEQP